MVENSITAVAENIGTLPELLEVLEAAGYEAVLQGESVAVKIGDGDHPFVAVMMFAADNTRLNTVCELATVGDLDPSEDVRNAFFVQCLRDTSLLNPFAVDLDTPGENPDIETFNESKIVLLNSVPVGDLSAGEVLAELQSLLTAITSFLPVLEGALKQ